MLYLTNRFQVAVHLFSNRSQMMSKCGKNKKVAHEGQPRVSLMFLPHFYVLCGLLLNRRRVTWNLFVLCNKELKKVLIMTSSITSVLQQIISENQLECVHNGAYYIICFTFEDFRICSHFNNINQGAWYVYKPLFGSSVATCQLACSEISLSIIEKKLKRSPRKDQTQYNLADGVTALAQLYALIMMRALYPNFIIIYTKSRF